MKPQAWLKSTFVASLALATAGAFAETTSDIACFTADAKVPTHFEMRTYFDHDTRFSFGSIKYSKSKTQIPIVLKSNAAEMQGANQPDEFTTTWLEIVDGGVTGTYRMVHEGVHVTSMIYTNLRTRKSHEFMLDTHVDSSLEKGCAWVD